MVYKISKYVLRIYSISFIKGISFFLPLIVVELLFFDSIYKNRILGLFFFIIFIISIFYPVQLLIINAKNLFDLNISRTDRLKRTGISFLISLMTFTNLFYLSFAIGDYNDSVGKYLWYQMIDNGYFNKEKDFIIANNNYLKDTRTFVGVNERLFSGVDYQKKDFREWNNHEKFPLWLIFENSKKEMNEVIVPVKENRSEVYISCFLYSVGNISNTGNSEINANSWDSRLLTAIEKLFSLFFIVLIFGMLLSGWWEESKLKRD